MEVSGSVHSALVWLEGMSNGEAYMKNSADLHGR